MTYGKLYVDEMSRILGITKEEALLHVPPVVREDETWEQEVTPAIAIRTRAAWRENAAPLIEAFKRRQETASN